MDGHTHVRVALTYVSGVTDPVRFKAGEMLACGHRDQRWTSYVWCTDEAGRAGWVPDSYFTESGPHEATALREYDATELTVARGERLEVFEEAGGWLLCRSTAGLVGWVPADHVEPAA